MHSSFGTRLPRMLLRGCGFPCFWSFWQMRYGCLPFICNSPSPRNQSCENRPSYVSDTLARPVKNSNAIDSSGAIQPGPFFIERATKFVDQREIRTAFHKQRIDGAAKGKLGSYGSLQVCFGYRNPSSQKRERNSVLRRGNLLPGRCSTRNTVVAVGSPPVASPLPSRHELMSDVDFRGVRIAIPLVNAGIYTLLTEQLVGVRVFPVLNQLACG
jgi:hypothetical protein